MSELLLKGINGANPLGFLATLGIVITSRSYCPEIKLCWRFELGAWRPVLVGFDEDEDMFVACLADTLSSTSSSPFTIEKKMPFAIQAFVDTLKAAKDDAAPHNRRFIDFLAAYGSDVHPEKGNFQDSLFRMVRSGDSAGQGLPYYAQEIRRATKFTELWGTLFNHWEYRDNGFSLRWDPIEDQRYALLWHDPSTGRDKYALKTMLGANALALEALALYPTQPSSNAVMTTGFHQEGRHQYFSWPIWDKPISVESIRSLVSLAEIHEVHPSRNILAARGIVEIYRSERVAPNKYYKNFSPAVPV